MDNTKNKITIETQVDDFISIIDDDCLDELLQEDKSPIEKLVALILNEATKNYASEIVFRSDGQKCYVSYKISGELIDQERPPQYLFPQIRNLYMRMAGLEYWQQGEMRGEINQEDILQKWDFEISEDHNILKFKPRTNWCT